MEHSGASVIVLVFIVASGKLQRDTDGLNMIGKLYHLFNSVDSQDVAVHWVTRSVLKGHIIEGDKWSLVQEILHHIWDSEIECHIQKTGKSNNYLILKFQISERIFVSLNVNEILRTLCLLVCSYTYEDCLFCVIRIVHFLIINMLCNI
jgi:hypothetical protein